MKHVLAKLVVAGALLWATTAVAIPNGNGWGDQGSGCFYCESVPGGQKCEDLDKRSIWHPWGKSECDQRVSLGGSMVCATGGSACSRYSPPSDGGGVVVQ